MRNQILVLLIITMLFLSACSSNESGSTIEQENVTVTDHSDTDNVDSEFLVEDGEESLNENEEQDTSEEETE